MARLEELATFSDEEGRLTRLYLSPAHGRAMRQIAAWMTAAGMAARSDPVGNVIGRYEAREPGAPALLIGSHIDTVVDAGRYDGALGVLAGIAAVAALQEAGERLPVALEMIAFGDEEGVRFPTTLTGSRALAGTLDPGTLEARDGEGVSLREALAAAGCDGDAFASCARRP
ncbi:MAG: argE, partial [Geminicoccaceae bacterium]|nr:argE [Geminicoccaceae bacterium]